jgi:hypothetical protein
LGRAHGEAAEIAPGAELTDHPRAFGGHGLVSGEGPVHHARWDAALRATAGNLCLARGFGLSGLLLLPLGVKVGTLGHTHLTVGAGARIRPNSHAVHHDQVAIAPQAIAPAALGALQSHQLGCTGLGLLEPHLQVGDLGLGAGDRQGERRPQRIAHRAALLDGLLATEQGGQVGLSGLQGCS